MSSAQLPNLRISLPDPSHLPSSAMDMMDSDSSDILSDISSPLSCLSASPSPPPELRPEVAYPSPPASQDSSHSGSPCPDGMDSSTTLSDKDGPPPAKRRRISDRKPRTTEYLDLRTGIVNSEEQEQLDRLLNVIHKRRKIVVVAGAGISVSAGIPDFRSSTGLFTSLRSEHNLKGSGKHLFDASVYKDDSSTSSFHQMVRSMSKLTKNAKPTLFHHMLATLAQDGRLLRLYSQNVDGIDTALEPLATNVPLKKGEDGKWPKTIQLHGGLDKMVCSKCSDLSDFDPDLFDGPAPPICEACVELDRLRTDVAGKRSHGIGRLRPRMVLYNEHNPDDEAIGKVTQEDLRKRPDAIIVVGTTLKVPGVRRIVREMCGVVRDRRDGVAIWINNDPEPVGKDLEDCWDIVVRGTCDEVARNAGLRRWTEIPDDQEVTEEQWKKAAETEVKVVINKSFKPVPTSTPWKKPFESPLEWSPMTSRMSSVAPFVGDSFTEEEEIVLTPPTPSKSGRNTPVKKQTTAFDALKNKKTNPSAGKVTKAKSTNVKYIKKSVSRAPVRAKTAAAVKKTAPKPQQRINQALKQTKSVPITVKAGKAQKSPSKQKSEPAMRPVSPEHPRLNVSPKKALFPNLNVSKMATKPFRMKIENIMN